MERFDYEQAYRNLWGILSRDEFVRLKEMTIAIPGMGGVGGDHLITHVQMGFTRFNIADPDIFEIANFNRQYGAKVKNIRRKKVEVMCEEALSINPDCKIKTFDKGITPENLDDFLEGVDFCIDGIDAFSQKIRRLYFNKAHEKKIPLTTAGPLGYTCAWMTFLPTGPNYDQYLNVDENTDERRLLLSFVLGLAPRSLHRKHMRVDPKEMKKMMENRNGPSSAAAIQMCAGIAATETIKVLFNKGEIYPVPYSHQFDFYNRVYKRTYLPKGNRHLLQRLKINIADYMMR